MEPWSRFVGAEYAHLSPVVRYLIGRRVCSMEVALYLMSRQLCHGSHEVKFLTTSMPHQRWRAVKPAMLLRELDADSTDVFFDGFPEKYMQRPGNDEFSDVTYAEYFRDYVVSGTYNRTVDVYLDLKGRRVQPYPRNKRRTVYRMIMRNPLDGEAYYFHMLMLFKPFRSWRELHRLPDTVSLADATPCCDDMLPADVTYRDIFLANNVQTRIAETTHQFMQLRDDVARNLTRDVGNAWTESEVNTFNPVTVDELDLADETREEIQALFAPTRSMAAVLNVDLLNREQYAMFNKVKALIHQVVFIMGGAGTGKSFLLVTLIASLRQSHNVLVLAPTGVAAYNIGGETVHRAFRIAVDRDAMAASIPDDYLSEDDIVRLRKFKVIVIDEVSMLSATLITKLNQQLQKIHNNTSVFGGCFVIFCGDLYQLPPVQRDCFNRRDWCFHTPEFSTSTVYELMKVERATEPRFTALLGRLRLGRLTASDKHALLSSGARRAPAHVTTLCTHRVAADNINQRQFEQLKTPINHLLCCL
eukprot:TRINITY_DN370_c0_g1_i1.p2 TRINITY_DN370_c0_g1~~TRINITY_DN370_c0_g1_i1.p2  ORF type:complete len:530 (+),score=96.82 TRINITY_DN370_c0_g1_i1:2873-4462(+)